MQRVGRSRAWSEVALRTRGRVSEPSEMIRQLDASWTDDSGGSGVPLLRHFSLLAPGWEI